MDKKFVSASDTVTITFFDENKLKQIPMTEEELFEIYKTGVSNVDEDGCCIDNEEEDFKRELNHILSQRKKQNP